MALIFSAFPACVLIFINGNSILPIAPVQTLKSPLTHFFLLYPINAQEILALLRKRNSNAHHFLPTTSSAATQFRSQLVPAWIITLASYLVSLIAYPCNLFFRAAAMVIFLLLYLNPSCGLPSHSEKNVKSLQLPTCSHFPYLLSFSSFPFWPHLQLPDPLIIGCHWLEHSM